MDSSVSPKDEIWFLRVFHHISNAVYHCVIPCLLPHSSTVQLNYELAEHFLLDCLTNRL